MKSECPQKIKVLHIIDGFGAGGAETWLLAVTRYLQSHPETGLHIDFLATGGQSSIYDEEILQTGARIFYIKYSIKKYFSFRRSFIELLKKEKYDAVHDHQDFISGWHFLSGLGFLPPIKIAHLHNPYNFVHNYVVNPGRWLSFRLGRLLTVLLTTKITGTSNAVMDEYGYNKWPYKSKRVEPAYCGFDVKKFQFDKNRKAILCNELGWNPELSKIALFTGRIGLHGYDAAKNQKNPEFAYQVAKILITANENWRFLFVGFKGSLGATMEAEIIAEGKEDKIKFLGLRNDVSSIMSASDVLVFPSLWEGLGMVVVEAQASGLPVVISNTVPKEAIVIKELVSIKKLKAGPVEWVNEILHVAQIPLRREMYSSGIAKSVFSIEHSVDKLIQLYSLNHDCKKDIYQYLQI